MFGSDLLIFDCYWWLSLSTLVFIVVPVGSIVLVLHALAGGPITLDLHLGVCILSDVETLREQVLFELG